MSLTTIQEIQKVSVVSGRLIVLVTGVLLGVAAISAQTVTEQNLLSLKTSNAPDELIIKAISMANKIEIDTSFENTVHLMSKGISQAVVDAVVQRKAKLGPQEVTSPAVTTLPVNSVRITTTCPQGDGAYFLSPSGWKKMEQAPLLEMSQNHTRATNPFGRKTMGSKLDGPEAPIKTGLQPEFYVVGPADISPRFIMVVKLTKNRNNRELTTSSSGVFRRTKIGEYDRLENLRIERGSDREITVKFPSEIDAGEYALMIGRAPVYDFSVRGTRSDSAN